MPTTNIAPTISPPSSAVPPPSAHIFQQIGESETHVGNFAKFVDDNVLQPGVLDRLPQIDAQQSCQSIIASCLFTSAIARNLEKDMLGFDKAKKKMKKDLELANRQANKYSEMAKDLKDREQVLNERIAQLEEELRVEKGLVAEKQRALDDKQLLLEEKQLALDQKESALAGKIAEVEGLNNKIASDADQFGKVVIQLKGSMVNQFENGFAKAVKQMNYFAPDFNTSQLGAFKMLQDGRWVDPPEEDEEDEE